MNEGGVSVQGVRKVGNGGMHQISLDVVEAARL